MNIKWKRKIAALLLGCSTVAVSAPVAVFAWAESREVTWSGCSLEAQYNLGETIELPTVTATQNGKSQTARSFVYSPDGGAEETDVLALDSLGEYEVEYRVEFGDKVYKSVYRIEVGNKIATTDSPADTVEYVTETAAGKAGLNVVMEQGGTLKINRTVDLRRFTADTPLVELFITPKTAGQRDFAGLKIQITDVYDENNSVTVDYIARTDLKERGFSTAYAGKTGGALKGVFAADGETYTAADGKGSIVQTSFYGGEHIANGFELYYNHLTNEVFGAARTSGATLNGVTLSNLIADVDSAEQFDSPFGGFKTGEVKISLTPYNFNAKNAAFVVTNIAGVDLSSGNYFREETLPDITVDYGEYTEDELPCGIVGKPYKLFDATATAGKIERRVYREYYSSARVEIDAGDGTFTPTAAGNYSVVYTAESNYGRVVEKVISLKAYTEAGVPDHLKLTSALSDTTPLSGKEGVAISLPNHSYEGGSGKVTARATVKRDGGEEKPCDLDEFFPELAGTYVITFYTEDYAGQVSKQELACVVAANGDPVFLKELFLPEYLIAGKKYALPTWTATQFGVDKQEIGAVITATGGVLDGNVFTPAETAENASITYTATSATGAVSRTFEIPVVAVSAENKLQLSKYFQTKNLTASAENTYVQYSVINTAADAEMQFINAVFAEYFSVDFFAMEGNNAFDSVDVVLRDSENAAETVFLRVKKGGDSTASVAVNGLGDFAPVSTSFAGNAQKTYFSIGYDSVKKTFTLDGQKFAVTQTANGETFNGFSSGRVYLTLKINGVYGAAGIGVKKVNNQIITKIVADTIAPEVVFTDFFGMYQKGSELTIAPAYALDVLDPEVRFTLTVTDRHGNAVYAKDGTKLTDADPTVGYTIVLEEYGSYSFIYQAEDTAGRKARYPVAINVRDDVAPVLETAGGYVKTMKVGSTLTVAKATVTDNVDEKLEYTVFLKSPDGQIDVLHAEKAVLSAKGVYTLTYMAIDSSGNIATVSYEIMVN